MQQRAQQQQHLTQQQLVTPELQ
ncbi:hypothetical protein M5D96_006865 [Drosophila gunungcola]|uniref:Uncharacterized protein n=1 Tax=Drosophila gunungcola TaxID=103775 RepID=A0A9Q0BQF1_9MUSC|nr:hypothetical protein M5D96_006865 [Drosophila gunungcola]